MDRIKWIAYTDLFHPVATSGIAKKKKKITLSTKKQSTKISETRFQLKKKKKNLKSRKSPGESIVLAEATKI